MIYDAHVTITVPCDVAIIETARACSRAFDPDMGGYLAFEYQATDEQGVPLPPPATVSYSTPISSATLAQLQYLMTNPTALKAAVDADYAERWPGKAKPTLAQIEALCAVVELT